MEILCILQVHHQRRKEACEYTGHETSQGFRRCFILDGLTPTHRGISRQLKQVLLYILHHLTKTETKQEL